jgi:3-hydroxybutyryl-CoA dehydratase
VNPEPKVFSVQDFRVGMTAQFEREIQEQDVLAFAANSGDFNPLHLDAEYAQRTNFSGRIVHGAFQVGLASALIGMHLPGRDVLLAGLHARFVSPLFYPCRVSVGGEITAWNADAEAGSVRVVVREAASHLPVSEITLAFTLHKEKQTSAPPPAQPVRRSLSNGRKLVLLTGASGGIGMALLPSLAEEFGVLAITHSAPLKGADDPANVAALQADLGSPDWEQKIQERIGDRAVYAVIHCAWPGMPRGGLLKSDPLLLEQQLAFGTSHVVRLANFLFEHADASGGHSRAHPACTRRGRLFACQVCARRDH